MDKTKVKTWVKKHPVWTGIIGFVLLIIIISSFSPDTETNIEN